MPPKRWEARTMAKLMDGSVCIMHDAKENVQAAYQMMRKAGSNVTYRED